MSLNENVFTCQRKLKDNQTYLSNDVYLVRSMVQEFCNLPVYLVSQVMINLSHKEKKKKKILNLKNNDSVAKISWYILKVLII